MLKCFTHKAGEGPHPRGMPQVLMGEDPKSRFKVVESYVWDPLKPEG